MRVRRWDRDIEGRDLFLKVDVWSELSGIWMVGDKAQCRLAKGYDRGKSYFMRVKVAYGRELIRRPGHRIVAEGGECVGLDLIELALAGHNLVFTPIPDAFGALVSLLGRKHCGIGCRNTDNLDTNY